MQNWIISLHFGTLTCPLLLLLPKLFSLYLPLRKDTVYRGIPVSKEVVRKRQLVDNNFSPLNVPRVVSASSLCQQLTTELSHSDWRAT